VRGGRAQQLGLALALQAEGLALEQAAAQGQVVDLVAFFQAVFGELAPRHRQRAGIAQVQHRAMGQRGIARERLQPLLRHVVGTEELAVVLERTDQGQPLVSGALGAHQSSPGGQHARMPADAPVAQLDRVLPSEGKGHRFESCRARHFDPPARRGTRLPATIARHARGPRPPFAHARKRAEPEWRSPRPSSFSC
jgi:hypothetical protein